MSESSSELKRPEGNIHERVMRCFNPRLRGELIMLAVNLIILFSGFLMMFFVYTYAAEVHWAFGVTAYFLVLAPMIFRLIRCILLWFYSDFPLMVETIVDALINFSALAFLFSGVMPLIAIQITVAVLFLINIGLTLYSYIDCLALYRRLVNKKYLVAEGVVIFKEKKTVGAHRFRRIQRTVVVRSSNGSIRPVEWVLRSQYDQCGMASNVLMVIPDPVESQINSNIRLAVEPFGQENKTGAAKSVN